MKSQHSQITAAHTEKKNTVFSRQRKGDKNKIEHTNAQRMAEQKQKYKTRTFE